MGAIKLILFVVILLVLLMSLASDPFVMETFAALTIGWFRYPQHVMNTVTVNSKTVIWTILSFVVLIAGIRYFLSWLNLKRKSIHQQDLWQYSTSLLVFSILLAISGIASIAILHQTAWLSREGLGKFDLRNDLTYRMAMLKSLKYNNDHSPNAEKVDFDAELKTTLHFLRQKWQGVFEFVYINHEEKDFSAVIAIPHSNSKFHQKDYYIHSWIFVDGIADSLRFYRTPPEEIIKAFSNGVVPKE